MTLITIFAILYNALQGRNSRQKHQEVFYDIDYRLFEVIIDSWESLSLILYQDFPGAVHRRDIVYVPVSTRVELRCSLPETEEVKPRKRAIGGSGPC